MVTQYQLTADSIGQEFVRQYYTLLAEAPTQLFRFYSKESKFVHGALTGKHEEESEGQEDIAKRLLSLNFSDVYTRIYQVDSYYSISDSVVIQVNGMISVCKGPMRSFCQTILLAPQGPLKYYVVNDIFRYTDIHPEPEDVNAEAVEVIDTMPKADVIETHDIVQPKEEIPPPQPPQQPVYPKYMTTSVDANTEQDESDDNEVESNKIPNDDVVEENNELYDESKEVGDDEEIGENNEGSINNKSWATMVKGSQSSPVKKSSGDAPQKTYDQQRYNNSKPKRAYREERGGRSFPNKFSQDKFNAAPANSTATGSGNFSNEKSRFYSDEQQLFIGNLPHDVTDDEIKLVFEDYGPIVDVRVNRNPSNSAPLYGFVIFQSDATVRSVLDKVQADSDCFMLRGAIKINVEEKRAQRRMGGEGWRSRGQYGGGSSAKFESRQDGQFSQRNRPPANNKIDYKPGGGGGGSSKFPNSQSLNSRR